MARMITLVLALAVAMPCAQAGDTTPAAISIPTLRHAVAVAGPIVRIGDLVANAGEAASIPIFRAPDLGQTGTVPTEQVLEAIRPHHLLGIDARNVNEVVVTRASRALASQDIEAHLVRFFAGKNGFAPTDSLAVTFDRELRTVHVDPAAASTMKVARAHIDARTGRFDVILQFPESGSEGANTARYTGIVFAAVNTGVTVRALARGDVIKPSDVAIERRPKGEIASDAVGDLASLVGMAVRQTLRAGQSIRRGDLMKAELVRRNDTVTLVYAVPGIFLTMRGKALESGADGDLISVLNVQSNRTVQGAVVGPGRVNVAANLPNAAASTPNTLAQTATDSNSRAE
ncbi:MAG: flagellar basal body P-ring formation protein FlgA [Proteobacteria bacterium]|nr:flagellar basal body P-ring formation protein FlgA [Pseudomonadota bacterium]